jgi:hypothetical protein
MSKSKASNGNVANEIKAKKGNIAADIKTEPIGNT